MNWWGRLTGLSLLLLVVFFSCEEDVSTIGIRRPDSKFRVTYAEIDIPSSVILFEKLATFNKATTVDGDQRLMVGRYQDNDFGTIRTEIFTQIGQPIILGTAVSETAVMDSLVLQLKTDFYHYGSTSVSSQSFQVHELQDTIAQKPYFNISKIAYKPEILGQKSISINPVEFAQNFSDNNDNVTTNNKTRLYRIALDGSFAQRLFETVRTEPELIKDFKGFTGKFKGFAIVPSAGDKIVGIDPKATGAAGALETKLSLYYTEAGIKKTIDFLLFPHSNPVTGVPNPVLGFTSIQSDRAGTVLQSLTEPNKDFLPIDKKRYTESGVGIVTKLDFTPYFNYMDTVKNPVLNSAELVFENESSEFPPPSQFQFRVLNDQNQYRSYFKDTLVNGKTFEKDDLELLQAYKFSVAPNASDGTMDLGNDLWQVLYVRPNISNTISAFLTEFFQAQYTQRKNDKRIKYCAFLPLETQFRKSVNRFVMKDNIKLKIYYTTPIVETIE